MVYIFIQKRFCAHKRHNITIEAVYVESDCFLAGFVNKHTFGWFVGLKQCIMTCLTCKAVWEILFVLHVFNCSRLPYNGRNINSLFENCLMIVHLGSVNYCKKAMPLESTIWDESSFVSKHHGNFRHCIYCCRDKLLACSWRLEVESAIFVFYWGWNILFPQGNAPTSVVWWFWHLLK